MKKKELVFKTEKGAVTVDLSHMPRGMARVTLFGEKPPIASAKALYASNREWVMRGVFNALANGVAAKDLNLESGILDLYNYATSEGRFKAWKLEATNGRRIRIVLKDINNVPMMPIKGVNKPTPFSNIITAFFCSMDFEDAWVSAPIFGQTALDAGKKMLAYADLEPSFAQFGISLGQKSG